MSSILVGYVRKTDNGKMKVSLNTDALKDCTTYTTSDGQQYVALVMLTSAIQKIINGERAVSTLSQIIEEE